MSTVICMASVKGGSGKTILAATFGEVLAAMGKRVLLVDTDAATNGLSLLYLEEIVAFRDSLTVEEQRSAAGTYELAEADTARPAIVQLPNRVSLLPASYGFFNSEDIDVRRYAAALHRYVASWRERFDFIFVDAQAGSDAYAHAAMSRLISDRVALVSEYDPLSAAGVERLKALFPEDLAYDRTWILLNKVLPDIASGFGEFLDVAKYLPPVPWDVNVVRAYARRTLALDLELGNDYTVAIMRTLSSLLERRAAADLEMWLRDKATRLRTPLSLQVQDAEMELQALQSEEASQRETWGLVSLGGGLAAALLSYWVLSSDGLVRTWWFAAVAALVIAFLGFMAIDANAQTLRQLWFSEIRNQVPPEPQRPKLEARLERLRFLAALSDEQLVGRGSSDELQGIVGRHGPAG